MFGEKVYGVFGIRWRPTLMIQDPELARIVLIKEFSKCVDRQHSATFTHLANDKNLVDRLWLKNLFMSEGSELCTLS